MINMVIGSVFLKDIKIVSEQVKSYAKTIVDKPFIEFNFESGSIQLDKEKMLIILKNLDEKDLEELLGELKK